MALVDKDMDCYWRGLGFESQTPYLFTLKKVNSNYLTKKKKLDFLNKIFLTLLTFYIFLFLSTFKSDFGQIFQYNPTQVTIDLSELALNPQIILFFLMFIILHHRHYFLNLSYHLLRSSSLFLA